PLFGHDVDESVLLSEIPLERLVSHTKGCYPGQEVVVRIRDRGHVNRRLTGLVLEGDAAPPHGAEVVVDGTAVGRVTSATRSLGLGRPLALALVRRERAEPGRAVAVRLGAGTVPARETSPYLLQHAHNPVDWYPWGEEAFARARAEDKPVLLSVGYSACHWCHVMERESFEDPEIAVLMNRHFVCVKVDREERPDV